MSEESGTQSALSRTTVLEFKSRSWESHSSPTISQIRWKGSPRFFSPFPVAWAVFGSDKSLLSFPFSGWLTFLASPCYFDDHVAVQEQRGRSAYPPDMGLQ